MKSGQNFVLPCWVQMNKVKQVTLSRHKTVQSLWSCWRVHSKKSRCRREPIVVVVVKGVKMVEIADLYNCSLLFCFAYSFSIQLALFVFATSTGAGSYMVNCHRWYLQGNTKA